MPAHFECAIERHPASLCMLGSPMTGMRYGKVLAESIRIVGGPQKRDLDGTNDRLIFIEKEKTVLKIGTWIESAKSEQSAFWFSSVVVTPNRVTGRETDHPCEKKQLQRLLGSIALLQKLFALVLYRKA